jgi:hypothetical protein
MTERPTHRPERVQRDAHPQRHSGAEASRRDDAGRPDRLIWLQRVAGNAAVTSLVGAAGGSAQRVPSAIRAVQRDAKTPPKIKHATGTEVDSFLIANTVLKPYVEGKMKGGTKAETAVKIHNAADFKKEWVAYAMARLNSDTGKTYTKAEAEAEEPDINAFQDDSPAIHVHESRGERATTIHESIHLFQDNSFLEDVGFNINEGTTEFFTREVTKEQKITRGNYYPDQFGAISKLVGVSSKEKLADAYFKHTMDGLKDAVEAKGKGTWDKWVAFVKGGKYDKAAKLLK